MAARKRSRKIRNSGPNRQMGIGRMTNTDEVGRLDHLPSWRQKLVKSQWTRAGWDRDTGRVNTRAPRGSKKTTVGKSKRRHQQRGSYSTRGRR